MDITQSNPELIRTVGLCNFDAKTTERIAIHLLEKRGQVGIVSNQVQYSLIDQRPRFAMAEVCEKYGIKLLTYGTFVSDTNGDWELIEIGSVWWFLIGSLGWKG